jgi:hypothetical protein
LIGVLVVVGLVIGTMQPVVAATQIDIVGPAGSGAFGTSVTVLPNGNIVVTDPFYDDGATEDVGAVYLYNGETGALISTLTGSTAGDRVGSDAYGNPRVTVLSNGNYVVGSPAWHNGAAAEAGAVTWGDGTTGVSGVVSAANSLVGGSAEDRIGGGVRALGNGNYVVYSAVWDNGPSQSAGAVTWGDGTTGITGVVSEANSLVGSAPGDQLAAMGVRVLVNGNYVVPSPFWDNGTVTDVGAVTWGDGTTGISGVVSEANSLVGSAAGDQVGIAGVTALSNDNYVVSSPTWHNNGAAYAGAATWGDGTTGITGVVSEANSLVGSTANDGVYRVTALSNGNYVVSSSGWDYGAIADVGAATWGDGMTGITGPVSAASSLVGSTAYDRVGYFGTIALSNGNYVVLSPYWDHGAVTDAGAVTWGDGTTGIASVVSEANSLVGSTANDLVGSWGVTPLSNGNYVVVSPYWDNGTISAAGAVTWGNGTAGTSGEVSEANSLVGSAPGDQVGYVSHSISGVTALSNGNYVVPSPFWDCGSITNAGAATWGDGAAGTSGEVSEANSLVGSTPGDQIGYVSDYGPGVGALSNGNYVVRSPLWDNGAVVDTGAATWGDGTTGAVGAVSEANSLVGSTAGDRVGYVSGANTGFKALSNGNYLISSRYWDNGGTVDAGAATWGNGTSGTTGPVSAANSLVGSTAGDQVGYYSDYTPMYALSNGDYAVASAYWDNGAIADAGAVTWGNGTTGTAGPITADNSVLGTAAGGGSSMMWWGGYDSVNHQLVVGRPAENIVTLFRLTGPSVVEVEIDIRPGSDQNPINLDSGGIVPVAILTTGEFDAGTVRPGSVRFAGAQPRRWTMDDVDRDGDLDLLLNFRIRELDLDETSTEATLTGETFPHAGGVRIEGTDTVRIIP